jgi:Tetracyclin repressor-like, C-terminal domain
VLVLASLLREGAASGELKTRPTRPIPRRVRADLRGLAEIPGFGNVPEAVYARGLTAWAHLFGLISFELFGRLTNAVHDYDAFFDHQMSMIADFVGFAG